MGLEAELKFRVPPGAYDQVDTERLPGRKLASPTESELVSTYFDTPKHKLRKHGLTLRVRSEGEGHVQTVKSAVDGRFGRGEREVPIEGDAPDLKKLDGSPLGEVASKKLRRKLKPVFATSVHRTRLPIQTNGSRLELAVDRGKITVGQRCELEP